MLVLINHQGEGSELNELFLKPQPWPRTAWSDECGPQHKDIKTAAVQTSTDDHMFLLWLCAYFIYESSAKWRKSVLGK